MFLIVHKLTAKRGESMFTTQMIINMHYVRSIYTNSEGLTELTTLSNDSQIETMEVREPIEFFECLVNQTCPVCGLPKTICVCRKEV